MYEDFKGRVCEGRGIHKDVINLIAGGRVMTGLKAFELNAPEDLIKQIKGLDLPPTPKEKKDDAVAVKAEEMAEQASSAASALKEVVQQSPVEKGDAVLDKEAETPKKVKSSTPKEPEEQKDLNRAAIVVIDKDQDTSPYAPPQPASSSSPPSPSPLASSHTHAPIPTAGFPTSAEAPTKPADPAAHNAEVALATSSPDELITPSPAPSSPTTGTVPAAGMYQVKPGPFGRGLIDGIGGIRDAMVYACELFVRVC